jgi:DNA-binding Lrp family transcriptional regulator
MLSEGIDAREQKNDRRCGEIAVDSRICGRIGETDRTLHCEGCYKVSDPQKLQQVTLDEVDQKLLGLLSSNSRRTNQSLSEALGLAPSTCLARLKALRDSGVIRRFTIEVDPEAMGLPLQALVSVRLRPGARHLMNAFGRELEDLPEIKQFFVLGGADDFLIHITARNTEHVRQFVLEHLSSNPAVAGTQTNLVFEHGHGTAFGH